MTLKVSPREDLIELAVEEDDDLMESYLEETNFRSRILKDVFERERLINFFPTFCGSAFKNSAHFEAVVDYLPSPTEGFQLEVDLEGTRLEESNCRGLCSTSRVRSQDHG